MLRWKGTSWSVSHWDSLSQRDLPETRHHSPHHYLNPYDTTPKSSALQSTSNEGPSTCPLSCSDSGTLLPLMAQSKVSEKGPRRSESSLNLMTWISPPLRRP